MLFVKDIVSILHIKNYVNFIYTGNSNTPGSKTEKQMRTPETVKYLKEGIDYRYFTFLNSLLYLWEIR